MSSASATPPGELERLVGVRSSKPTYYAAWKRKSERLDHTIETLKEISAALCTTTEGPLALCEAVVDAAAHHFSPRWAAMAFAGDAPSDELPPVIVRHADGTIARRWDGAPPELARLAEGQASPRALGAPMQAFGTLAIGLPAALPVDDSDRSILGTLANQATVALHIALLFEEVQRHAGQLERARRGLERARRQELLSQERGRIARELHDSVAQHIVGIGMSLEWCRQHLPAGTPVADRVAGAKELARATLSQVRSVIDELSPPAPAGLAPVLRDVVGELRGTTDLQIALRTRGAPGPLSPAAVHALSQIAREALFNVARHAEARRAWVTLRSSEEGLRLAIADDGTGDPRELQRRLEAGAANGSHRGLGNIAERARELGGEARFARRRGGGVRLELTVAWPRAS